MIRIKTKEPPCLFGPVRHVFNLPCEIWRVVVCEVRLSAIEKEEGCEEVDNVANEVWAGHRSWM